MKRFEMDAPIILESNEEIAETLEAIARGIREGRVFGSLHSEVQCVYWGISNEDEEYN